MGQPELQLIVSADRPQAFVATLLIDGAPDGAASVEALAEVWGVTVKLTATDADGPVLAKEWFESIPCDHV